MSTLNAISTVPRITIVTPSFNQAPFLEQTIVSILDQDYPNLEFMVIDGGSTDGSVEIIRKYADHLAFWVSEKDRGQVDAINKGLQRATGDLFIWINSDDLCAPETLKTVAQLHRQHPSKLLYGQCQNIDAHGNFLSHFPYVENLDLETVIADNLIPQPSCYIPMEVVKKIGPLNEQLHFAFDYEYWLRAWLGGFEFIAIPVLFSLYRLHETSKTETMRKKFDEEIIGIHKRLFTSPPPAIRRGIAKCYRRFSLEYHHWFNDRPQSMFFFHQMLRQDPRVCDLLSLKVYLGNRLRPSKH